MKTVSLLLLIVSIGQAHGILDYYMDNYCQSYSIPQIDITYMNSIRLHLTANYRYSNNMNCSVSVTTSGSSNLMFYFKSFNVDNVNFCQNDFLELHDGPSLTSPYANGFYGRQCGPYISTAVYTTSNSDLTLWFHSDDIYSNNQGFDMVITSFHYGYCFGNEHRCDNGRCIDTSVTCNGYNPCGDYSDCSYTAAGPLIAIVVGCTVCSIIIVVIVILVVRRRRRYVNTPGLNNQYVPVVSGGYGYNQPVPGQYQAPPPNQGNAQQNSK